MNGAELCLIGASALFVAAWLIEKARNRAIQKKNYRLSQERDAYIAAHNELGHGHDMMSGWPPK